MTIEPLDIVNFRGDFETLPDPSVPYYVPTKEGTFIHKRTLLGRLWCKVDKIDALPEITQADAANKYYWEADRIPGNLIGQAEAWFAHVWELQRTEAALLLTYNPDDPRRYRLYVPPQKCSMAHVEFSYDATTIEPDWAIVGSIHSHCNFSPHQDRKSVG